MLKVNLKNEQGFSLIELIVAVAIIVLLILIVLYTFVGIDRGIAELVHDTNLRIIDQGVRVYRILYGKHPDTIEDLVTVEILEEVPDIPSAFGFSVEDGIKEYYLNENKRARPLRTSGDKPVYGLGVQDEVEEHSDSD